jgi:20S proteasome subunit beta 2
VADKNCSKIHFITDNIYACGAGTAADLEHVTGASGALSAAQAQSRPWAASQGAQALMALSDATSRTPARPPADMVSGQIALHRYGTGRQARVITAMTMFKQHLFK